MATMRLPPQALLFANYEYTLGDALIEALGDLAYGPAADELFKLQESEYAASAARALRRIVPGRLTAELLATAKDKKVDSYLRERALVTMCNLSLTNRVRDIVPLLDDVTPIVYSRPLPGPEWRICDRAVVSIAQILGWEHPLALQHLRPQQREDLMNRVREWAREPP